MTSHQSPSSITDVVPANFLCDNQTMKKIAQSQLLDEKALSSLEENLSALQSRRRGLMDELATVDGLISKAVAEQTRLRSSIATHKSLLAYSPVLSLPGEILSEIFLHYISLSQSAHRNVFQEIVASHRIHAPILLVCRRWRTTALADPRLWTTIPLVGSSDAKKSFAHPLISGSAEEAAAYWKALENRIERTSALPLQLLFNFKPYCDVGDPMYTTSSLQTFIRLFPRAHSISISLSSLGQLIPELSSVIKNAEISKANQVHTARVNGDDRFVRKILAAIPNVEVLEMGSVDVDRWFMDVPAAGHRLRSLHLLTNCSPISLVTLLDLLDRAPLLETLKVGFISITPSVGTRPVVTHTVLSTFHIASAEKEENDALFGHLTLPALRSLSYGGPILPEFWPRSSNVAFLRRSGCMLTELAFRRCQVDEKHLAELLTAQKAIVTLRVNHFPDDEDRYNIPFPTSILASLAKATLDRLSPALEVVSAVVLPQQLKAVKQLIQSRSTAQARKGGIAMLRAVDIQVSIHQKEAKIKKDKKDEHTAMFKPFVDKGIGIGITYTLTHPPDDEDSSSDYIP